jgi:mono/diheme cytochrome c family protein
MRWLLRIVLGLVVVVVVVLGALYAVGTARLNQKYSINEPPLAIPVDAASIARGHHLAVAVAKCTDCHTAGLRGQVFLDVPPFRIIAPNLTRGNGGVGASLSDADFIRAIRDGVSPDGHGLLVMPSSAYAFLSDADLADIIAWVKSVPAVANQLPATDVRPLGRVLFGAGQLLQSDATRIDHSMPHIPAMREAATIDYGRYMARTGGCTGCHGAGLSGGAVPGVPASLPHAQNITPTGIGSWSDADLVRSLRTGKRPDGTTIDTFMPWPYTAQLDDTEMKALVLYLRSVPPRPDGMR